jgi:hypothetical protein
MRRSEGPQEALNHADTKWVKTGKSVVTRKDKDRKNRYARDGSAVNDFPEKKYNRQQQKWADSKTCFDVPAHSNEQLSSYQKRWLANSKALEDDPDFGFSRDGSPCELRQDPFQRGWNDRSKICDDHETNFVGNKVNFSHIPIEAAKSEDEYYNFHRTLSGNEAKWASSSKTIPNARARR